ncbi:MAG: DMSO reductase anchor subunit [Paracoccaceae bacterium]|jgi:DMSO reductase anchor subunit
MHPAPSIIVFTVLSGLGFGLLFWLGIAPAEALSLWHFALAFGLAGGGLLASTFHLGNPQRAWRAFSQWKTSWLSREAVLAVICFAVMGLFGASVVFLGTAPAVLGALGAVLALATVIATSMIYAQLKTVPRWNQWTTPALFTALSLCGGAILTQGPVLSALLLAICGALLLAHWGIGDTRFTKSGTNMNTATGLHHGTVRAFESPHTGTNYLLKEMVFVVARKHALKLRAISFGLLVVLPVLALLTGGAVGLGLAMALHLAGVFVSRWLFFAEAEHVVGLYYGMR